MISALSFLSPHLCGKATGVEALLLFICEN